MPADLAALGLVLPDEHLDADLFNMIAKQPARNAEWNAARGEAAHLRLLASESGTAPTDRKS